jgi:YhcH/YjgK/YiaL family protein
MILDVLENSARYECLHPRFKKAFDFLKTTDWTETPVGRIELEGEDLYANVQEVNGKTVEAARMETHDVYVDIQVPLSTTELMGWMPRQDLKKLTEAYDKEKDVAFYGDRTLNLMIVRTGEFAIFFPEDGHQPCIGQGKMKKVIIKVKL